MGCPQQVCVAGNSTSTPRRRSSEATARPVSGNITSFTHVTIRATLMALTVPGTPDVRRPAAYRGGRAALHLRTHRRRAGRVRRVPAPARRGRRAGLGVALLLDPDRLPTALSRPSCATTDRQGGPATSPGPLGARRRLGVRVTSPPPGRLRGALVPRAGPARGFRRRPRRLPPQRRGTLPRTCRRRTVSPGVAGRPRGRPRVRRRADRSLGRVGGRTPRAARG